MEAVMISLEILRRLLARIGPYALVELLLPGGTLLALLLYLYRRRKGEIYEPGVARLRPNLTDWRVPAARR